MMSDGCQTFEMVVALSAVTTFGLFAVCICSKCLTSEYMQLSNKPIVHFRTILEINGRASLFCLRDHPTPCVYVWVKVMVVECRN
jgi:hypothetical protein